MSKKMVTKNIHEGNKKLRKNNFNLIPNTPGVRSLVASHEVPRDRVYAIRPDIPLSMFICALQTEHVPADPAITEDVTLDTPLAGEGLTLDGRRVVAHWTDANGRVRSEVSNYDPATNEITCEVTDLEGDLDISYMTNDGRIEVVSSAPAGSSTLEKELFSLDIDLIHSTDQYSSDSWHTFQAYMMLLQNHTINIYYTGIETLNWDESNSIISMNYSEKFYGDIVAEVGRKGVSPERLAEEILKSYSM